MATEKKLQNSNDECRMIESSFLNYDSEKKMLECVSLIDSSINTQKIKNNLHKKSNSVSPYELQNIAENLNNLHNEKKELDIEQSYDDSNSEIIKKMFSTLTLTLNDFTPVQDEKNDEFNKCVENNVIIKAKSNANINDKKSLYEFCDAQKWLMSLNGVNKFIDLDILSSKTPYKNLYNNENININEIFSNINGVIKTHENDINKCKNNINVHMSCFMQCQYCGQFLYDEDVMSGWSFNDSNFNFQCLYCSTKKQLQTANLRIVVNEIKNQDCDCKCKEFFDSDDKNVLMTRNIVYISPLTLRKELEYTIEQNGIRFLMCDSFPQKYPILFWNLVILFIYLTF